MNNNQFTLFLAMKYGFKQHEDGYNLESACKNFIELLRDKHG